MGRIAGDGSDLVMINGRQVRYQGIGHIRKDVTTAQAVEKTSNDGYKKYFLESADKKERLVVYGDRLDFSFKNKQTVPVVVVNGKPYNLAAHDDQDSSWIEGFVNGAKNGVAQAGGATIEAAKQVISQIGVAGAMAVVGGTGFVLWRGVEAKAITGTFNALAVPALKIIGTIVALGTVVSGLAGGIKGAAEVGAKKHDTKNLASIIDTSLEGDNPDPGTQAASSAPPAEQPVSEPVQVPPPASPIVTKPGAQPSAPGPGNTHTIMPILGEPGSNSAARRIGAALQELEKRGMTRTPARAWQ